MQRPDPVTGKPRGFLRMGAQPRLDSVLFTLRRCGRCLPIKSSVPENHVVVPYMRMHFACMAGSQPARCSVPGGMPNKAHPAALQLYMSVQLCRGTQSHAETCGDVQKQGQLCTCRAWQSAAEYWQGPMRGVLERAEAASAGQAVRAAVQGAPLDGVAQFLATRQDSTCSSATSASCTQPAAISTVRTLHLRKPKRLEVWRLLLLAA